MEKLSSDLEELKKENSQLKADVHFIKNLYTKTTTTCKKTVDNKLKKEQQEEEKSLKRKAHLLRLKSKTI